MIQRFRQRLSEWRPYWYAMTFTINGSPVSIRRFHWPFTIEGVVSVVASWTPTTQSISIDGGAPVTQPRKET